jgi:hypothetical protein
VKKREIEQVLEPGESLVWEGRPAGYQRPRGWYLAIYVAFTGILLALPVIFFLGPYLLARLASSTVTVAHVVSFYTVTFTITGTGGGNFFGTFQVPGPVIVGFVVSFIAFAEVERIAHLHARRYGITDRRVIALDRHGRTTEAARGAHEAKVEKRALVYGPIRFEGIADVEAARSALVGPARG